MKIIVAITAIVGFAVQCLGQGTTLTIYQDFAVVRERIPLTLKAGVNDDVQFSGMTATAETDSVILRDPSGRMKLKILQQSYRNDPVSKELLLALNRGKTIDFMVKEPNRPDHIVQGKIIDGGWQPGQQDPAHPIIEVDGKKQFTLPGEPVFPVLADDTILNPTISLKLNSDVAGSCDAQLAYVTGGFSWEAVYDVVGSGTSDDVDLTGWVSFDNESGKTFKDARVKFMAGDVSKLPPWQAPENPFLVKKEEEAPPPVGELLPVDQKALADFHLYTLNQPVTLRDKETKQVEFVLAQGVKTHWIFIYDGGTQNYGDDSPIRGDQDDSQPMNRNVWMLREFKNSADNNLGVPLPSGNMLFYQRDTDGQPELASYATVDNTPKDETIRAYAGYSQDLAGTRIRTDFEPDEKHHRLDEAFEIKLRNHKGVPAEIRVVEHLTRYASWEVETPSDAYSKTDSQTIEFRPTLKPNEEKTITYRVHYTW